MWNSKNELRDRRDRLSLRDRFTMLDEEGNLARGRRLDRIEELHRLNNADCLTRLHRSAIGRHLALAGSIAPVERAVERREDGSAGRELEF